MAAVKKKPTGRKKLISILFIENSGFYFSLMEFQMSDMY